MSEFFEDQGTPKGHWNFLRGVIAAMVWVVFLRGFHFVVFMKAGKLRWDDTLIITGMYLAAVAGMFWLFCKPRQSNQKKITQPIANEGGVAS